MHGATPTDNFKPYTFRVSGPNSKLSNPFTYFDAEGNLGMLQFDEYYLIGSTKY